MDIFNIQELTTEFTVIDVLLVLSLSFTLTAFIGWVYQLTHRGTSYTQSFVFTLVLNGMVVALVMLIVGSNLARAFSLVGALSIIRFRNAVKETRDVGFIFFTMAIGMAVGTRFYLLAVIGAVFISLVILLMIRFNWYAREMSSQILRIQVPNNTPFDSIFDRIFLKFTHTSASVQETETVNFLATDTQSNIAVVAEPITITYNQEDLVETAVESAASTTISLQGDAIAIEGGGASVDGSVVTITAAGTYQVSGTLDDGQIIVETADEDPVVLVLNGVDITSSSSAPIFVSNAEKVVITLADGSENTITDTDTYLALDDSGEPNAAIFSKDDLTINGDGSLIVNANYNNGIASKDDLKITGGNITVYAENDGIKGRDSLAIKDGTITVQAGGDGLQANNDEDPEKGYIVIEGGVLDIIAGLDGIEATRRIRAQYPEVRVLVLTTYDDDEWVFDAIRAGASGYLLKDTPREEVIKAVRGTVEGRSFLDPSVAGKLMGQVASQQTQPATLITDKLTDREVDVLRLLARGFTNADIAARLYLSEGTVRNHVSAIFAKLDVTDRTQAAIIAIHHGLDGERQ